MIVKTAHDSGEVANNEGLIGMNRGREIIWRTGFPDNSLKPSSLVMKPLTFGNRAKAVLISRLPMKALHP